MWTKRSIGHGLAACSSRRVPTTLTASISSWSDSELDAPARWKTWVTLSMRPEKTHGSSLTRLTEA